MSRVKICSAFTTVKLSRTYLHQLPCHSKLSKGFQNSQGRSSTPRFVSTFRYPECACRNGQDGLDENLSVLHKIITLSIKLIRRKWLPLGNFLKVNILHKIGETRRWQWYGSFFKTLKTELKHQATEDFHHCRKLFKGVKCAISFYFLISHPDI